MNVSFNILKKCMYIAMTYPRNEALKERTNWWLAKAPAFFGWYLLFLALLIASFPYWFCWTVWVMVLEDPCYWIKSTVREHLGRRRS